MQFKNFFANEDNTSLLQFSELITNNLNPAQNAQDCLKQMQDELSSKDNELKRLQKELKETADLKD